jgi:hypothetical protein
MTGTCRNITLAVLGERVRLAVETLIQGSTPAARVTPKDTYVAATRVIMRLLVILLAEARELLPIEHPSYRGAFGVQALREQLERSAGERGRARGDELDAWPRLLSLFRLSDDVVAELLTLLTHSKARARQGRAREWIDVPVDYASLGAESIGILYEGLLDYELHPAGEGLGSVVRRGGARKGSGTFYTPPQLAGSTVRRTIWISTMFDCVRATDGTVGENTDLTMASSSQRPRAKYRRASSNNWRRAVA